MNLNHLVRNVPVVAIAIASIVIPSAVSASSFNPKSQNREIVPLNQAIAQVGSSAKQIKENELRETAKTLDQAWKKRDLSAVMKFIAPFAISKVVYEYESGSQTINLEGKESHKEFVEKVFKDIKSSDVSELQAQFRVSSDGNVGTVTTQSVAFISTAKGNKYIVTSDEVFNFAIVGDQMMLISFTSKNRLDPRPDKKPTQK